jgi:hypothetical protein
MQWVNELVRDQDRTLSESFPDNSSAFGRTRKVLGAASEYYAQVAMEIE